MDPVLGLTLGVLAIVLACAVAAVDRWREGRRIPPPHPRPVAAVRRAAPPSPAPTSRRRAA